MTNLRRYSPRVESLETRNLLSAAILGAPAQVAFTVQIRQDAEEVELPSISLIDVSQQLTILDARGNFEHDLTGGDMVDMDGVARPNDRSILKLRGRIQVTGAPGMDAHDMQVLDQAMTSMFGMPRNMNMSGMVMTRMPNHPETMVNMNLGMVMTAEPMTDHVAARTENHAEPAMDAAVPERAAEPEPEPRPMESSEEREQAMPRQGDAMGALLSGDSITQSGSLFAVLQQREVSPQPVSTVVAPTTSTSVDAETAESAQPSQAAMAGAIALGAAGGAYFLEKHLHGMTRCVWNWMKGVAGSVTSRRRRARKRLRLATT